MVILIGMAAAALAKKDAAAFFNVFLVLKLLTDIGSELPQWDPKEPPMPLRWIAGRAEKAKPGGEDLDAYWKRIRGEQKQGFENDEQVMPAAKS